MKVRTRWYDRVMTGLSFGALLAATLYVLLAWKTLPEHPPSHFDFHGAVDAWGNNKTTILTPLALAWFLFGLVTFTEHMPSTWNTVSGVRPANIPRALRLSKTLIGITKTGLSLFFAWSIFCAARGTDLGAAATPLLLIMVGIVPLVFVVLLLRLR